MSATYEVIARAATNDCNDVWEFDSERDARRFINDNVDGERVFHLIYTSEPDDPIVSSRFPVLMIG